MATPNQLHDRFLGCMIGMAVGDALGAAGEFLTERQLRETYGTLNDYHETPYFDAGEFTDDTAMALAICESIIEAEEIDIESISERFLIWMQTDGRGIGILTLDALRMIENGISPLQAGRRAWEKSGQSSAGNGAVMRCAPIALFDWNDPDRLAPDSIRVSRITHYDPRCCWSCVAVNTAIVSLLRGEEDVVDAAKRAVAAKCPELDRAIDEAKETPLRDIRLDGDDQGYTLLTTKAALAALLQYHSFEDGILAIINKGGDADTNATVAGALLGAKYGLSSIPQRWIDGLISKQRVLDAADALFELST